MVVLSRLDWGFAYRVFDHSGAIESKEQAMSKQAILNDVLIGNVRVPPECQFYLIREGNTCYYGNKKKVDDVTADLNRHIREGTNIGKFIKGEMPASLQWTVMWW